MRCGRANAAEDRIARDRQVAHQSRCLSMPHSLARPERRRNSTDDAPSCMGTAPPQHAGRWRYWQNTCMSVRTTRPCSACHDRLHPGTCVRFERCPNAPRSSSVKEAPGLYLGNSQTPNVSRHRGRKEIAPVVSAPDPASVSGPQASQLPSERRLHGRRLPTISNPSLYKLTPLAAFGSSFPRSECRTTSRLLTVTKPWRPATGEVDRPGMLLAFPQL